MKIGLIGEGFVGSALRASFEKRDQDIIVFDKYRYPDLSIDRLKHCSVIFMCLPTPHIEGHGFELGAILENLKALKALDYRGLCVIKSTVEPGSTRDLSKQFDLEIVHNPEFLSERTAFEDFDNQKHIVIGASGSHSGGANLLKTLYADLYPSASISICKSEESESMKLFCNNFYAMKVQIFNEFYFLCQRLRIDYEEVANLMILNGWINPMHTMVPGPDGSVSYGGACFPKDTNALLHFMKTLNSPCDVLEACIKERRSMRKD